MMSNSSERLKERITKEVQQNRKHYNKKNRRIEQLKNIKIKQELRTNLHIKNQKLKKVLTILAFALIIIGVVFLIALKISTGFKIEEYKKKIEINFGTVYDLKYPKVCYGNFIECKELKPAIKGNYDVNSIGTYDIEYEYKYKNKDIKLKQKIIVKDLVKPELTVNEETIKVCPSGKILNIEASAVDNVDGDLTTSIKQELDGNILKVSVEDLSGNKAKKEIEVELVDKDGPVITLKGNDSITLATGDEYKEEGATALDGCDGDREVNIDGTVDTTKEGDYIITYTASDSSGNKNSVLRKISVKTKVIVSRNVYLTFDDGPGPYTQELLDMLDQYGVKVTFFVTNQDSFKKYQYLIAEEAKRGHTVAVHTLTHKWNVYDSLDSYFNDFNAMNDIIEQQTGKRSKFFRFPGGSSNTVYCKHNKTAVPDIINYAKEQGYVYFDWNVDSNDAAGAGTEKAYNNVIKGVNGLKNSVVLMHDIHKTSIPAAQKIIEYGLNNGYVFKAIDDNTPVIHHGYHTCR